MTISLQQFIALLPLIIVGFTIVIVMLSIAWRRNHFLNATISVIGLNAALLSFWFVVQVGEIEITPLMRVDGHSIFYSTLVLLASLATCTFAYPWLEGYNENKEEFYILVLISVLGGILLANTNHLSALFLGSELISIPLFGLIGYAYRQKRSLEASIKYTILSATASSFLLFGIALLYANTGNLSFIMLSRTLSDTGGMLHDPVLLLGFGMMIVSFGFKLSFVPFHLWTPDVYQGAPSPVSTFLSTASKIAIFGVVIRFFLYVPMIDRNSVQMILGIIAFVSIIFGNLMALTQSNIKRLLGYSSLSHFGYLLILLISIKIEKISMEAIGVYLSAYMFSNIGAFGVISLMSSPYRKIETDSLFFYRGLFWHRPILSAVMTIMMLSLAGIPMTLGFIGKFYVLAVTIQSQLWWLTSAVVIGSAISLYYYLRVAVSLYLSAPQKLNRDAPKNWYYSAGGIVVLIAALLVLFFGIYPQPLIDIIQSAIPVMYYTTK